MQEKKKPNMLVIVFLLAIVVVSSLILFKLFKAEQAKVGKTTPIVRY